jgi:cell division protein ZapB
MKYMQNVALLVDASQVLQHSAACVETEFSSLEAKVAQFVSLCERLRAENVELRQQLAAARSDAKRLHEKINGAKARLEGLLARLPG